MRAFFCGAYEVVFTSASRARKTKEYYCTSILRANTASCFGIVTVNTP